MPINTDPEALDAFDSLDDNDKSSLIDEMSDDDAISLTEAMTTHRANKNSGLQVGMPEVTNRVEAPEVLAAPEPEKGIFDSLKGFASSAQERAAKAGSPFDTSNWSGTPLGFIRNVDAAKAAFVDPAVRAVQENVFRPAINAQLAGEKKLGLPDMPAVELARRAATQWLAGPGIMDDMPEDKKLQAVNDLESVYRHPIMQTPLFDSITKALPNSVQDYLPNSPEKKAAYSLGVSDQVGQVPLMFIGGGKVASMASKAGTAVGRIAGHMVSGALAMSTVALVTPGQKLSEAAVTGALFGGGTAGAGEAVGAVGKAIVKARTPKVQPPEVLGVGLGGWVDDVITDLSGPIATGKLVKAPTGKLVAPPEVTPADRARMTSFADQASADMKAVVTPPAEFQPAKLTDPNFKPGLAYVTRDPSGGMKGRMAQVKDGQAFIYEKPINNLEDAHAFYAETQQKGAPRPMLDRLLKDWNGFTDDMAKALGRQDKPLPDMTSGNKTVNMKGKQNQPTPTLQLDAPPPDLGNTPVLIIRDADGLKLRDLNDKTDIFGSRPTQAQSDMPQGSRDHAPTKVEGQPPAVGGAPAGGGLPPEPPPPPPFRPPDEPPRIPPPQMGELSDEQLRLAQNLKGMILASQKQPGVIDKVLRQLVGTHLRGPIDLAQLAAMQKGVQHLEASGIETIKALQRSFGQKLMTDLDKDLMKLATAPTEAERILLSDKMSGEKYGPLWNKHKEKVHELLRERDILDQTIAALGGIPDNLIQLREAGQVDAYVARTFMAYILSPGQWAKIISKNAGAMDRGMAWLRKEHGLQPNDHNLDGDLRVKLHDIIGSNDPIGTAKSEGMGLSSASNLKKKQDLPPALLELLGENQSGAVGIGMSLGSQRAVVANLGIWREIAARPDWCQASLSSNPQLADLGWKKLPDNKRWYGDAAGQYLSPQVYDTMVTLPNTIENSKFLFQGIMSYVKGNEVALGGAGPWINNTMGNVMGSILAGGLDPLGSPIATGRAIKRAANAMLDFRANPSAVHKDAGLVLDARRLGVEAPGFFGTEVDPLHRQLTDKLMKEYAGGGDKSYFSILQTFGQFMKDAHSKVRKPFGVGFDQNDRLFKLANWIALADKFRAMPGKYLDPAQIEKLGLDEAAKRLAAYRVNLSFQSPDKLGPSVDKLRKGAPGILAKYMTPMAEELRVAGTVPSRLLDEPDLAFRLFKYTVAIGAIGAAGGIARRQSGIPDEEVDAALALRRGERHGPDLMQCSLPWRDSKGRAQIWDLTPHVPMAKFFEASPDQGMFSTVLVNAGLQATSGGVGEGLAAGVMSQAGVQGLQSQTFMPPRPGEEGVLKMLDYGWRTLSLGPKVVTKTYDTMKQGGMLGGVPNTQEQLTGGQVAGNLMGARVKPFTMPGDGPSPTAYANVKAMSAALGQLKGQIPGIAQMPDDQAMAMLPELMKRLESDPRSYKDVRMKATIDAIKTVLGKWKTQGNAVRKVDAARKAPPSILPDWAK